MAEPVWVQSLLCLFLLLSHHTIFCSGSLVGFSYDSRDQSDSSWLLTEAISFLETNRIPISQFKLILGDQETFLDSLPNMGIIPASLCLDEIEAKKLLENSRTSVISWPKNHLLNPEARLNISTISVSGSRKENLPFLRLALRHVQESLKTLDLDATVKVSAMFSLSALQNLDHTHHKAIQRIMQFLRNSNSFAVVEVYADAEVRSLDAILLSTLRIALSAIAALPYLDIPIVLQIRTPLSHIEAEIHNFSVRVEQCITAHPLLRQRISGLFFNLNKEEILNHGRELATMDPIIYPPVAPITVPATDPGPSVVTVPSTNPVSVIPTNPTMTPVTIPSMNPTNPVTTPITVPVTNPLPTPMTNPETTPTTIPISPPTTYPSAPSWSTPSIAPPVAVPSTYPVTPAVAGQTWCVAKSGGVPDATLQSALNYACGIGGVDCSALQPTGSCSYPDTFQAHASYAFNSYYQRNPVATSCDFGGTAMLVNVNPSSATCVFLSSSSSVSNYNPTSSNNPSSNYNPASSTPGSTIGSGSSVSNASNSGSSSSVFGSSNPTGYSNNSFSLLADWTLSLCVLMIASYITITI